MSSVNINFAALSFLAMALFGSGRAAEVLVANVAGKIIANDAYWAEKCTTIPSNALFIVVEMGAVRDHFKPVEGATFCDMLQSNDTHQWSYNAMEWSGLRQTLMAMVMPMVGLTRTGPATRDGQETTESTCLSGVLSMIV